MSPPERLLWAQLKGRALEGWKFRRQHPLETYVLDFYCPQAKLAIEVGGEGHSHPEQAARDARRDAFLDARGIRVLRFRAREVFDEIDGVVRTVLHALQP